MDPMEMTDEEFDLHRARGDAGAIYRRHGFLDYAEKVERGEADECSQVKIMRWLREPITPPGPEYMAAWAERCRL